MTVAALDTNNITGVHGHAIAQLSIDLHLPKQEVAEIYRAELERIGASARIHHYLSLLASSNARSILRRRRQPAAVQAH